jgi:phosphatidylinositol 4-kinase
MDDKNVNLNSIKNKFLKLSKKSQYPVKLIKTNRAECHHIDDDDNFNLFDYLEEDFFSTEKAIKLRKEENKINEKERDKIFLNFMPAVKCLKRMSDEEEKNKNINPNKSNSTVQNTKKKLNNGALYEFIYSDKFNIDLLMIYLNKENNITIIDTLIELMYQKYINQSLFYLPQLCMFFNYKEYYSSIKSYLLDRCIDQIKFSLQITWLLNSFIEDETPLIKSDIYEWLLQKIEETLVNGERNTIKLFNQHIQLQKEEFNNNSESNNNAYNKISNNFNFRKEKSIEMLPFLEKQSRSLYFNICNEFYSSLKFMCEDLKNYPKENDQRKNKLIEYINNFNENFEQQRIDNEDYLLNYPSFFGIILPFNDSSSAEDIDSSLIIRIIPEQCFCFSTKARVPTKICAECIQVKELNNSEYLNSKKTKNKYLKSKAKNNLLKTFTVLDDTNTNLNINKYVGNSFQRKKTTKVRQLSLLGNHNNIKCSSNNSLEYNRLSNKSQISEENEEEEKGEKLRKFLYNINKTIEEEGENILNEDALYSENDKINNGNEKESQNKIVDDFEILPEITEDLKNVFGKPMRIIKKEIQMNSPFKNFKTYKLVNFIAKANDDLRQELLAMQLIKFFDKIFKEEKIPLFLRTYEILITSSSSGLLEFLENTSSIDGIKKKMATSSKNLSIFYKKYFKEHLEDAQINFTRSLAAYSLVCYYLQIKDRHNGNILIDMNGNIIHIDFGFILGIAPGGINFEKAPFKLTREYVEIMGGKDSLYFQMYKDLMVKGMIACKKYVDNFISIAEIMSKGSKMPCFDNKSPTDIFQKFKERFYPDKKDEDFINIVNDLINWSYDNFRTNQYDNYQKLTNGILP